MWSTDQDSELEEEFKKRGNTSSNDWFQDLQSKFNDSTDENDDLDQDVKPLILEADEIILGKHDTP